MEIIEFGQRCCIVLKREAGEVYVYAWVCVGRSQTLPQEIQMENGLFLMKTFMDKTNFQGRNLYLLLANSDVDV